MPSSQVCHFGTISITYKDIHCHVPSSVTILHFLSPIEIVPMSSTIEDCLATVEISTAQVPGHFWSKANYLLHFRECKACWRLKCVLLSVSKFGKLKCTLLEVVKFLVGSIISDLFNFIVPQTLFQQYSSILQVNRYLHYPHLTITFNWPMVRHNTITDIFLGLTMFWFRLPFQFWALGSWVLN